MPSTRRLTIKPVRLLPVEICKIPPGELIQNWSPGGFYVIFDFPPGKEYNKS